mgnify:CR=1 FL=1
MPIITISRGSYYHGKSVADKLAAKLGYTCLSRDQILEELEEFHLPELKLVRGLHDAFSVLDRFPHGKARYIKATREQVLNRFTKGNIVYHGLVGHHFVQEIGHVLKVRIIADTEWRVADEMKREGISEAEARYTLKKDDEERRKWGIFLHGIDIAKPDDYNLVLRVGHVSEEEAVDLIASAAALPAFQETEESVMKLKDLALKATVSRRLFDFPNATVSVKNGDMKVILKAPEGQQELIKGRMREMLLNIDGLRNLEIRIAPFF